MSLGKLPTVSGLELIKFFTGEFGCTVKLGKGSHVLVKGMIKGRPVAFPVPLHHESSVGVLLACIREPGVKRDDLIGYFRKK